MDLSQRILRPEVCPDCGAALSGDGNRCWLCGWKLDDSVGLVPWVKPLSKENPSALPAPPNRGDLPWTFALSMFFLWTASVAVVMGVLVIAPGLGVALGIFSVLAALHTIGIAAYRKRQSGHALTASEKLLAFIGSLVVFALIAVAIVFAAFGALFAICLSSNMSRNGKVPHIGDVAPVIAATAGGVMLIGFVVYFLIRGLWRSKG